MLNQFRRNIFLRMLSEICAEQNITLERYSLGWVRVLTKGASTHYITGYKFDLNPAAAAIIADDKFATYEILKSANLPVIEHDILYDFNNHATFAKDHNSYEAIEHFWQLHNHHIVIKPNDGTCGRNVLSIKQCAEILPAVEQIFPASYSASLCPFVNILREYRTVLLDNDPRLVYAKERMGPDWRFNLSQGATSTEEIDPVVKKEVIRISKLAAHTLNLRFCSCDIVETVSHELLIMEINSGVMIKFFVRQHPETYDKVKAIYSDAVQKMFQTNQ